MRSRGPTTPASGRVLHVRVTWLIETEVFPSTAPRLLEALQARGDAWFRYEDGAPPSMLPAPDACVIFWGSLGAAYEQRVAARWRPGAIGNAEAFRCSAYYQPLGPVLANADAVFTTAADLVAAPAETLGPLGNPERVFVRPDSPLKPFAGRTLARSSLSLAALDHGFYYDDERLPIVVSTAKPIGREWRFVVADGVPIAGCEYDAARRGCAGEVPAAAYALAESVARRPFQPAPLYIVDIAEVEGTPRVLELNPFSGADLYDCDAPAVLAAAARVAERLYGAAPVPTR
jgi:hypothetical protein